MTKKYKRVFVAPEFHKELKKLSADKGKSMIECSKELAEKIEESKKGTKRKPNYMKII